MTPKIDEIDEVHLPQLATVELPGMVDSARCWMVPGQDWHGYAIPYFDAEQAQLVVGQLESRGLAFGQLDDDGKLVLSGPAITGVYVVPPMIGMIESRPPERVWPLGGGRWPWVEKSMVADERPIAWPQASPTPGLLQVRPIKGQDRFELVAVLSEDEDDQEGAVVATGLAQADAERMAMVWNQTLGLDGLALAGGLLGTLCGDDEDSE